MIIAVSSIIKSFSYVEHCRYVLGIDLPEVMAETRAHREMRLIS